MEEVGKEITSTGIKPAVVSKLGNVVTINGRRFLANGRWNTGLVADFLLEFGNKKFLRIGEVARFAHCSNTIPNKEKVRAHLSLLFRELMSRGVFMAIEYSDANNAASAVKIADLQNKHEHDLVMKKIARMKKSRELTQAQYEQSIELLHKTIHKACS